MGFRENLKAELAYQGMLVKELADRSGINKRTLDNYLREKGSQPSAEAAVLIASVLGVSAEFLVTGRERQSGAVIDGELKHILHYLQTLNRRDRRAILGLAKTLKSLEESEKSMV